MSVTVQVLGARDLIAADKNGYSDPFATAELINSTTGEPVKKTDKLKTKTVKKTLDPTWDEQITWTDIKNKLTNVSLRVTINDADTFSSQCLGVTLLPLTQFLNSPADVIDWYPLELNDKMTSVQGAIQVSIKLLADNCSSHINENIVEESEVSSDQPTEPSTSAAVPNINCLNDSSSITNDRNEETNSGNESVWIKVLGARDLIAADKNGYSDPFATAELINSTTGEPVKKTKKLKTKTVKKTLDPTWSDEQITWTDIKNKLTNVSLRVTINDADTFSSQCLGVTLIPLTQFLNSPADVIDWYPLELNDKMTSVQGAIQVSIRVQCESIASIETVSLSSVEQQIEVQHCEPLPLKTVSVSPDKHVEPQHSETSSMKISLPLDREFVSIKMLGARDLIAADKNGYSDPFATAELIYSTTKKPIKNLRKLKTKTVKKTLNPTWSDEQITWTDIKGNFESISLRISINDVITSQSLGVVIVPLTQFMNSTSDVVDWYPLESNVIVKGKVKTQLKGLVQFAVKINNINNSLSLQAKASKKTLEGFEETLGIVRLKILEARNLPYIDIEKELCPDTYVVAELLDMKNGHALEQMIKKTTKTISQSQCPYYNHMQVGWNLNQDWKSISLQLTVYQPDKLSNVYLGRACVPLSWRTSLRKVEEQWFTLYSMNDDGVNTTNPCGEIKIILEVEETSLMLKKKRKPTWKDRMNQCETVHGKLKLDFSRLNINIDNKLIDIFTQFNSIGKTLLNLNLKGNNLKKLPEIIFNDLPNLKVLIVSNNELSDLSKDVATLAHLELLAIDHNHFSNWPDGLFEAPLSESLLKLNAQFNQFTIIAPEVGRLKRLGSLLLSNNNIKAVSYELDELIEGCDLDEVDLSNNPCLGQCSEDDNNGGDNNAFEFLSEPLLRLLEGRNLFRNKAQRTKGVQRNLFIQKRLAARRRRDEKS